LGGCYRAKKTYKQSSEQSVWVLLKMKSGVLCILCASSLLCGCAAPREHEVVTKTTYHPSGKTFDWTKGGPRTMRLRDADAEAIDRDKMKDGE
jgi:hypothetical protein